MRPLDILFVDDPSGAGRIGSILEQSAFACKLTCVSALGLFQAALQEHPFDLIIANHDLPGWDSFAALATIRENAPGCPVIFISRSIDVQALELLKGGATDFIPQAQLARLPEAVQQSLRAADVARERGRLLETMTEQGALLDAAQEAIIAGDLEGQIHYWSKGAERMHGWRREEVVGRKTTEFLYKDLFWFPGAVDQLRERNEWSGEVTKLTKAGTEVLTETHWSLVRDNAGKPRSVLSISTDITEKKRLEAKFLRAQRLETLGTLAGGIAHDLNNLLAPVILGIDLLRPQLSAEAEQTVLNTMQASIDRAAEMVLQIVAFARGASGERALLDLRHLIKEIERFIQQSFPRSIRIQTSVDSNLHKVTGNATQLHQVLLNLCVNARDAMAEGGCLEIKAANAVLDLLEHSGPHVVLSVTDTGEGMSPALLDKIFEPFFTTKPKGTGLGLSTVQEIVKDHGGFLEVASEVGKGTGFKVYLPTAETLGAKPREPQLLSSSVGKSETILVGDDEIALLEITREMLETCNYRVLLARDGKEVVELYQAHKDEIAAIIVDMMMPKMDGPAAIEALKQIDPAVKIIGVTGLDFQSALASQGRSQVEIFLKKPFAPSELLTNLRALIES